MECSVGTGVNNAIPCNAPHPRSGSAGIETNWILHQHPHDRRAQQRSERAAQQGPEAEFAEPFPFAWCK